MKGYEECKGIVTRLEFEPKSQTFIAQKREGCKIDEQIATKKSDPQKLKQKLEKTAK